MKKFHHHNQILNKKTCIIGHTHARLHSRETPKSSGPLFAIEFRITRLSHITFGGVGVSTGNSDGKMDEWRRKTNVNQKNGADSRSRRRENVHSVLAHANTHKWLCALNTIGIIISISINSGSLEYILKAKSCNTIYSSTPSLLLGPKSLVCNLGETLNNSSQCLLILLEFHSCKYKEFSQSRNRFGRNLTGRRSHILDLHGLICYLRTCRR